MDGMTGEKNEPFLWTGHYAEDGTFVTDWSEPLSKNLRRAKRMRRAEEARFRHAPFPLYGLPQTWSGTRRLGGGEWATSSRRETVHALSLVHGSKVRREGPSLVVETAAPDPSRGGGTLRCIAGQLWFGDAQTIEEAQVADRGFWGEDQGPADLVRRRVALRIEGRSVPFDTLWQDTEWVGYTKVENYHVTVEGFDFEPEEVDLVRITDVGPYIEGGR